MPVPQRFNFIVGSRGWASSPPPTVGLFDIPAVRQSDFSIVGFFDSPTVRQGLKPLSHS
ncbi:hypothetical protein QUA08_23140 [Microcoleus sp. T3B2]|uniref:hypothetical protein n=1 Tax=Microcoleus sp. T3B2 TaxID=3055426 RepID=UPI002FD7936E